MRFLQNVRSSFAYLRNVHGFNGKARVSYCSMPIENCKICDLNLGSSLTSKVQALASRVQALALALRVQALRALASASTALASSLASRVKASALALRVQALALASRALALALVLVLQLWP